VIEDVLGVRAAKPGQPQIMEAGIGSGLAKIAASALKGASSVARTTGGTVGRRAASTAATAATKSTAKSLGAQVRNVPQNVKFGPKKPTPTRMQTATAAKAAWSPKTAPNVVVGRRATGVSGRVLNSPGAQYVRANRAAGVPAGKTVAQMAGNTARGSVGTATAAVKAAPKPAKYGAGAAAAGTALYYTGRATSGGKKPGYVPMTARTAKKPGYVPMTVSNAAAAKPRSTAGYVPNAPSSPRKKLTSTPTAPSVVSRPKSDGKGSRAKATSGGQGGLVRKPGTSVRTAAVQKRLGLAAEEAAKGNLAAAAAYANAALNIQKKGKGSAASMKKVQKTAAAYAKAAKK